MSRVFRVYVQMGKVAVLGVAVTIFVLGLYGETAIAASQGTPSGRATVAAGPIGFTWYLHSTGLLEIVEREYGGKLKLDIRATGGGGENQRLVGRGESEFGYTLGADLGMAFRGLGPYKGQRDSFAGVRGVFAYPFGAVQIITRYKDGIRTMDDLKGKNVAIGAPGAGAAVTINPILLEEHGMTSKNTRFHYLTGSAAVDQLKNGHVHAIIFQQLAPASLVMDIATSHELYLVPMKKEAVLRAVKRIPGSYLGYRPGNSYGSAQKNTEPILTLRYAGVFMANRELAEDLVYHVTKAIFENLSDYQRSHAGAKDVKLENALEGMSVPLHPGAVRYYREKGLTIPKELLVD